MRLLVITNDFPPAVGGIENYTYSLVKRWDPSDVVVISRWMPGCEAFDAAAQFDVVREPVRTLLPTPGLFARAQAIARERGVDVVHFPSCLPLGMMGPPLTLPYAVSVHGGEFLLAARLPGVRRALHRVCSKAAVLLPESSFAEALIARHVGPDRPVERVTCGIDPERYPARDRMQRVESRVIVSVSRLVARKGQTTLIRALPALLEAHPGTLLSIVGSGPYLRRLKGLTARLGVERAVSFAGEQPWENIPAHLSAADVFALPTRARFAGVETEGLPLVLVEAAASELPMVAGDVGGIRDVVRPGETGLLVDGSSVAETADAIASLLDQPAAAARMGARARRIVLEEFTWDLVAEKYKAALSTWCA